MIIVRILLALAGVALMCYAITLLLDFATGDLLSIALWFAAGILLHDAVLAPLSAIVGVGARRILPRAWWAAAACGAVCTVALVLIAIPVLGRGHAVPDNPTVLDRNYPVGLAIILTIIWLLVLATTAQHRRKPTANTSGRGS
ncbi:hypothetical protein OHA40_07385 [Nocardia sp. NBC_00508]|uniref:hypothetical protein n=1 Tax=Nocardia sp. NBC_00508 TaxID=2975992 RepID=UPI002E819CD9|nr:hypothetical protein [Nocardia sp. NBC_00508]WUD67940.1 hypothetical protein OHA40_07385 [Nocardia sp. NBC_00508]